jgi:hyperosmotically inducible periplasmic protein
MNHKPTPSILATLALTALLAACSKPEEQTAGQKLDETITKTEQAGAEIKADAQQMANQAGQALTDAGITTQINAALAADDELKALQINVDTKDGRVVLTGAAPNANAQQRATMLAQAVEGVMAVDNRLVLSQG